MEIQRIKITINLSTQRLFHLILIYFSQTQHFATCSLHSVCHVECFGEHEFKYKIFLLCPSWRSACILVIQKALRRSVRERLFHLFNQCCPNAPDYQAPCVCVMQFSVLPL